MFKKIHVFRVMPGKELLGEIARYCQDNQLDSGVVLGIIGSLQSVSLNFVKTLPAKFETLDLSGPLELVCAQGTIALMDKQRLLHIHAQVSGRNTCTGGHLSRATIFSTAEVVIGELDYQITRRLDAYTGLNELTR